MQLIVAACLLLAGKVDENFKQLQRVAEQAYFVRMKKDLKALEEIKHNNPVGRWAWVVKGGSIVSRVGWGPGRWSPGWSLGYI